MFGPKTSMQIQALALGYGVTRKIVRLWDAKVDVDYKKQRQLLVTEKVVIGAVGGFAALCPPLTALMLLRDAVELESYVRGQDNPLFTPFTHAQHLIA